MHFIYLFQESFIGKFIFIILFFCFKLQNLFFELLVFKGQLLYLPLQFKGLALLLACLISQIPHFSLLRARTLRPSVLLLGLRLPDLDLLFLQLQHFFKVVSFLGNILEMALHVLHGNPFLVGLVRNKGLLDLWLC